MSRAAEAVARGEFETGPVVHRPSFGWSYNDVTYASVFIDASDLASNIYDPTEPDAPAFASNDVGGKTSSSATSSLFVNHELSFFDDRLTLMAGLRDTTIRTRSYDASTGAVTARYDESAITPAFGVVVKPIESLSLYANYIEALESGGTAPNTAANAGEILAPLVADQIEIGAKVDFGHFGATLSAFQITRQNAFTDPVTNVYRADGEQTNRGIEATVFGEPFDGIRVIGGVMVLDAELSKTVGGAFNGNTAIGVPDYQARLSAEWDVPQVEGLTLTGSIIHTGSQFVDQANTQSVPDWTRLDLGARYAFQVAGREAILRLSVENVFDLDYWSSVDRGSLYAGSPRTFLASTTFKF